MIEVPFILYHHHHHHHHHHHRRVINRRAVVNFFVCLFFAPLSFFIDIVQFHILTQRVPSVCPPDPKGR